MRALVEGASATARSDLKAGVGDDPYLPRGIDLAAAMRRGAEAYKAAGVTINTPVAKPKPVTLAESREDLAKRITDPVQRAYVLLSGRDR